MVLLLKKLVIIIFSNIILPSISHRSGIQVFRLRDRLLIVIVRKIARCVSFPFRRTLKPENRFAVFIYLRSSIIKIIALTDRSVGLRHLTLTVGPRSETQVEVVHRLLRLSDVGTSIISPLLLGVALNFLPELCIVVFGSLSRSVSSVLRLSLLIPSHHPSFLLLLAVILGLLQVRLHITLRLLHLRLQLLVSSLFPIFLVPTFLLVHQNFSFDTHLYLLHWVNVLVGQLRQGD